VIAKIFGLLQGQTPAANIKQEQIMLDFHYINYEFCKENAFSNEKTSTLLAIMDFLLQYMLERQILPEEGFKILKRILERHSL
jgi:CRISPR/Cas system CSM-associated protein Csm2 small subunit